MALELLQSSKLIKQGAEARIYIGTLHPSDPPVLLKHRFSKKYRHSSLDTSLTRLRIGAEARAILRCIREGVRVPTIRLVDAPNGILGLELIEGKSVRQIIPGADDEGDGLDADEELAEESAEPEEIDSTKEFGITHEQIMELIGIEVAKMHLVNIIHGDLTTSNMMVRKRAPLPASTEPSKPTGKGFREPIYPAELILIDFGLTTTSALAEDKAVDLYVLERAFASTHPESESLFQLVLDAYGRRSGKAWPAIFKRLEEVRLRGRKRSMLG
ncbi:hypothetical protein DL93DRAFT_2052021 [Clavulina sp. PMI_390]|nr:hypothetical protein DL93DRAFT_2052021 [Clavulina sp. PMI_390]